MAYTTLQPGSGWWKQLLANQDALKGSVTKANVTGLNGWNTSNLSVFKIDTLNYAMTIMTGQVTYTGSSVNSYSDYIGTIASGVDPMVWQHCIISGYGKFGELINDGNGSNKLRATMNWYVRNNTVYQVYGMIIKEK